MAMKFQKGQKKQSIREEFIWSKNRIYGGYMQPTFRTNPDNVVIQIGTNDLPSKKESTEYSNEIVNLALKLKSGTSRISIPNGQYHRQTLEERKISLSQTMEMQ